MDNFGIMKITISDPHVCFSPMLMSEGETEYSVIAVEQTLRRKWNRASRRVQQMVRGLKFRLAGSSKAGYISKLVARGEISTEEAYTMEVERLASSKLGTSDTLIILLEHLQGKLFDCDTDELDPYITLRLEEPRPCHTDSRESIQHLKLDGSVLRQEMNRPVMLYRPGRLERLFGKRPEYGPMTIHETIERLKEIEIKGFTGSFELIKLYDQFGQWDAQPGFHLFEDLQGNIDDEADLIDPTRPIEHEQVTLDVKEPPGQPIDYSFIEADYEP